MRLEEQLGGDELEDDHPDVHAAAFAGGRT
jgi:hypothetical protein